MEYAYIDPKNPKYLFKIREMEIHRWTAYHWNPKTKTWRVPSRIYDKKKCDWKVIEPRTIIGQWYDREEAEEAFLEWAKENNAERLEWE